jgi:hypothetical protein
MTSELDRLNQGSAHPCVPHSISGTTVTANPEWEPDAVVCRGSWMLGTACGHCSRCAEALPKAMAYFRDKVAVLEGRLGLVVQMIPPPSGMGDYADTVKVHPFEALRAQLYDEKRRSPMTYCTNMFPDGFWPFAWGAFACCLTICITIYKLRKLPRE